MMDVATELLLLKLQQDARRVLNDPDRIPLVEVDPEVLIALTKLAEANVKGHAAESGVVKMMTDYHERDARRTLREIAEREYPAAVTR